MIAEAVGLVGSFFGAMACMFVAQAERLSVMEEINRKLPGPEHLDLVGWQWGKSRRLRDEYKRLYPDGRQYALIVWLGVASYVLLGVAMFLLWKLTHQ
jgi:hypothetical protein